MSKATIAAWVRKGRLHPRYRGVFAYGHPQLSQKGEWMAALLAAGDGAILAGWSAAVLLGTSKRVPREIDVLVPKPRASQPGYRARTCRNLDPRDVVVVDRIPVTTVARMLVDLSDEGDPDDLALLMDEAAFLGKLSLPAIRAAKTRANGRHKLAVLDEAIRLYESGSAGSRSRNEKRFRRLVRGAGLPEPRRNVDVNGFEVDFVWPGLCVEIDGKGHRRPSTRVDDRIRDAALRAAGYVVLRFRDIDVARRPDWVLSQLAPYM